MEIYRYDTKDGCPEISPPLNARSRIMVVGTSGSGKSTLAALLASRLRLHDIELDALYWNADWQGCGLEEFRQRIQEAIGACGDEGFVIHGNYNKVRDLTWSRCDSVIWLDYSKVTVMRRVVMRTFARVFGRKKLWQGNRETFGKSFLSKDSIILWAWNTHESRRAQYLEAMAQNEFGISRFIVLRDPSFVTGFLSSIGNPS